MTEVLIAFLVSFIVRLFSTLASGGAGIMIPVLLFMGLAPDQAIATNRLSNLSNVFSLLKFHQYGFVKWKLGLFLAGFTAVGAAVGSFLVITLDTDILEKGIGVILLASVPMIFFGGKNLGLVEKEVQITKLRNFAGGLIMTALGIFGGFFSSTGVWFSYVYLYYYGLTFLQTTATRKISGFAIVLVSLAIFIPHGLVVWPIGLAMFAGGGLGAYIAAHYSKRIGNIWIRRVFAAVVLASAVRILFF